MTTKNTREKLLVMNNIYFKFLFILSSLFFVSSSFAETPEDLLLQFENDCVHASEINQEACDDLLARVSAVLEENPTSQEDPRSVAQSSDCNGVISEDSSVEQAEDLSDDLSAAASSMQCTEKDREDVLAACAPDLSCNLARSVATAVDKVAPSFVSNRVRDGIELSLSGSGISDSSSCMDSEQSDCLTEVVTSFVANIVGTYNTLKDVAATVGRSIWGLKDYLFKKSDDLHQAANSTTSEISKFIDSPWLYIKDKFMGMKNAVDNWIKSEVFCQKWDGAPHIGTCVEPLESYGCLNCNDGLNAFCAGAGLFASEAVIAIGTAGTLTAANIAMKAGLRLGATTAARAATRIVDKVPALARRQPNQNPSAVTSALSKTAQVSMATLKKMNEAVMTYKRRIGDAAITRNLIAAGKSIEGALQTATKPLVIFDDIAERTMTAIVRRGAAKQGSDRLSHMIRAASRYERARMSDMVRRGERISNTSKRLFTTRVVRRTGAGRDRASLANSDVDSSLGRDHSLASDHSSSGGNGGKSDQYGYDSNRNQSNNLTDQQRREQQRIEHQREQDRLAQQREQQRAEQQRQQEREQQRQQEREQQRQQEEQRLAEQENQNSRSDNEGERSIIPRATRYAVAGDLAEKVRRGLNNSGDVEATDLITNAAATSIIEDDMAQMNTAVGENGMDRKSIEQRTGQRFATDSQAREFANAMSEQYSSNQNRAHIMNSFTDKGYSYNEAEKIYNAEREFYQRQFLNDQESAIARAFGGVRRTRPDVAVVNEEFDSATSLVSDIRKQISDLENQMGTEGNFQGRNRVVPSATPTAAPTPYSTPRAGGSGSSYRASNAGFTAAPAAAISHAAAGVVSPAVPSMDEGVVAEEGTEDPESIEQNRAPSSITDTENGEKSIQGTADPELSDSAIAEQDNADTPREMGKVDYLDLYFKLMEEASDADGLNFSQVSSEDLRLTSGQINDREYQVLNIVVKDKRYKIFRHNESGDSVAFKVGESGLDFLSEFPKDLI